MEDLASKKCVGHDQVKALSEDQIKEYLHQIKQWELLESKIQKTFKFNEFTEAMDFVNKVAKLAEEEGHHPDIEINYTKVTFTLSTHFLGGLSENDFIIGAKIDQIT